MRTTALAVLCLLALTTYPFAGENPPAPPASAETVSTGDAADKPADAAAPAASEAKETPRAETGNTAASRDPDPDQSGRDLSRSELCDALATSAQNNDVPVAFFTSLIWQESRFDTDSVSSAGAKGVAQFMPKVAQSLGLKDPFDPRAALRTSARLLRSLFEKFGNFGLAAAAYNAGPKRIHDWLANRGKLPQETRDYVRIITGRPAEHWRGDKIETVSFKLPQRMPCPRIGVFAELPQANAAAETSSEAKPVREKAAAEKTRKPADEKRAQAKSAPGASGKQAERKDDRATAKHARARVLGRHNPKAEPTRSNRKQLIARQGSVKLASLADDERRPNASKRPRRS